MNTLPIHGANFSTERNEYFNSLLSWKRFGKKLSINQLPRSQTTYRGKKSKSRSPLTNLRMVLFLPTLFFISTLGSNTNSGGKSSLDCGKVLKDKWSLDTACSRNLLAINVRFRRTQLGDKSQSITYVMYKVVLGEPVLVVRYSGVGIDGDVGVKSAVEQGL
ncbi:hypothetical protein BpHYR1_054445 [Brachionus plicatilis]|uniref:Uncharacterized protein n=1 Tax=Brachionus plicatilis TaxID=10195 RepID=A0A3M7R4B9_BRAPC|nr:hypothetical protein BpHYR1_054445 [Brachionus plicatilis]